MNRLFGISLFIIVSFSLGSCNIINPDEPIPTFIKIDSFNVLSVAPATHGSVSENISDAWVYVNSENIGNFQLPATVPVILEEGTDSADISIYAGIKVDGFSFNRRRYIFFEPYKTRLAYLQGQTQNWTPEVTYRTTNNYELLEDFESGNAFEASANTDTSITRTTDPAYLFEGTNSGLVYLDATHKSSNSVTTQSFILPSGNVKQSFMELDYKNDVPFTIEVQLSFPNSPTLIFELLSLNSRTDWNKVYINLTDLANGYPGRSINFIIRTSLPVSQNTGFVSIDNLKIITQ